MGASRLCAQMAPCLWPWTLLFSPGAEGSGQGYKRGSNRGSKLWLSPGYWRGPSLCSGLKGEPPTGLMDGAGGWAGLLSATGGCCRGRPGGKDPRRDSSHESEPAALTADPGEAKRAGRVLVRWACVTWCQQRGGRSGLPSRAGAERWPAGRGRTPSPALPLPAPRVPGSLVPPAGSSSLGLFLRAQGRLLPAVFVSGSNMCLCPGSPSPDPGALLQGHDHSRLQGPCFQTRSRSETTEVSVLAVFWMTCSAPNIPPASCLGMRQGDARSVVAVACKARDGGTCTFLTDSLLSPPFPRQNRSPGSSPGVSPVSLCFCSPESSCLGTGGSCGVPDRCKKAGGTGWCPSPASRACPHPSILLPSSGSDPHTA